MAMTRVDAAIADLDAMGDDELTSLAKELRLSDRAVELLQTHIRPEGSGWPITVQQWTAHWLAANNWASVPAFLAREGEEGLEFATSKLPPALARAALRPTEGTLSDEDAGELRAATERMTTELAAPLWDAAWKDAGDGPRVRHLTDAALVAKAANYERRHDAAVLTVIGESQKDQPAEAHRAAVAALLEARSAWEVGLAAVTAEQARRAEMPAEERADLTRRQAPTRAQATDPPAGYDTPAADVTTLAKAQERTVTTERGHRITM